MWFEVHYVDFEKSHIILEALFNWNLFNFHFSTKLKDKFHEVIDIWSWNYYCLAACAKLKHKSAELQSDFTYIHVSDDEPDVEGSPHHYILIHGILTAPVIYHLNEIGVNVDSIICVKAQNYDSLTSALVQPDESKDDETAKVS